MNLNRQVAIRVDALAAVLRREIEARGGFTPGAMNGGHPSDRRYAASIADEIAASGLMSAYAAKRRVWAILNGENATVNLDVADRILTALDLSYLLHTELADAIVTPSCSDCGCPFSERTFACKRCSNRHSLRKKRAKRALASRPGLGGLSGDRELSPPRGGTSEGTTLKEAA